MAFGRELKDFVEAFKAGSSVAQGAARLALQDQQIKTTDEYRKAVMGQRDRQFGASLGLRRDALAGADRRHSEAMKLRERQMGVAAGARAEAIRFQRERAAAADADRRAVRQLQRDQFDWRRRLNPGADPVTPQVRDIDGNVRTPAAPPPTPVSAVPVDGPPDLASVNPQDDAFVAMGGPVVVDDDDKDEAQAARRGGMIRSFEDGGYVEEDDYGDDEDSGGDEDYIEGGGDGDVGSGYDPAGGAIPSQVTPPQAPAQQLAARTTDLSAGLPLNGGIKHIQENLPQRQEGAIPAQRDPLSGNFHQFVRAFPEQDYADFIKTIDPENKLGPAVRELAQIKAIYDYNLRRGDIQAAERSAASLIIRASHHSAQFGAEAERLIRRGDFKQGAELLRKSYDHVPDGRSGEVEVDDTGHGMLVLKDAKGEVVARNPFGPQQMLMAATGLRNGSLFWQELTGAAHRYMGNTGQPTKAYQDAISGLMKDPPAASAVPASATRPEAAPASTAAGEGAPEEAIPTSGPPSPPEAFDPAKVNVAGMRPAEAAEYRAKVKARQQDSTTDYYQRAGEYLDGLTPKVNNTSEDDEYARPTRSREQEEYLTKLSATPQGRAFAADWRKRWDSTYVKPYEEWKKAQHEADKSGRTKEPTYDQIQGTTGAVEEKMDEIFFKPFDRMVDSEKKDGALVGTGKPFTSAEKMREALGPKNIRAVRDIAARLAYFGGIPVDTALEHTATLLSSNPTSGALKYQTSKPNSVGDVRMVLADGSTFKVPQTLLAKIDSTRSAFMGKVLEEREVARKSSQSQNTSARGVDDVTKGVTGAVETASTEMRQRLDGTTIGQQDEELVAQLGQPPERQPDGSRKFTDEQAVILQQLSANPRNRAAVERWMNPEAKSYPPAPDTTVERRLASIDGVLNQNRTRLTSQQRRRLETERDRLRRIDGSLEDNMRDPKANPLSDKEIRDLIRARETLQPTATRQAIPTP